jgi:hypothetical protein
MTATMVLLDPRSPVSSEVARSFQEDRSPRRRVGSALAATAAAMVLVAYLVGGGALRFDWLAPLKPAARGEAATPVQGADAVVDAERAGIDMDHVIDSVRHRVSPVAGRPGELTATDDAYRARFDAAGFQLRPTGSDTDFGVSLRAVVRGGQSLPLGIGAWYGVANRAERPVAPGMREVVTARDGEIEWDVLLSDAPPGHGDLVVSADLAGTTRVDTGDGGLRIHLAGGGELRMGSLVVKDATGAEVYRAVPQIEGGRLRLEVPDRILAHARYPLTLDPTVSPEHTVSSGPDDRHSPDIAFDGTNYLVVWLDERNGANADIYGARVRPDGVVLDPGGIPISTAAGIQSAPQVSYYGSNYLVVWTDYRNGITSDIYGARVRTNGTVVDLTGAAFSTATGNQYLGDLAFDGTNLFVVWTDHRNASSDIYGTRWSPTSGVLNPTGIAISLAAGNQATPAVTFYGPDYLVVWQDFRNGPVSDIYGAVVLGSGVVRDTGGLALNTVGGDQEFPDVAFNGSVVLIVWNDARSGSSWDLYGARFSPAQGLIDGNGLAISAHGGTEQIPSVAASGSTFLVEWLDNRLGPNHIYGTRVANNGTVIDPTGIPISTGPHVEGPPVVIKGNGSNWATTYSGGSQNILFRTVSPK